MEDASVAALVRDLTAQLAKLTTELNAKVAPAGDVPPTKADDRALAQTLVEQRMARYAHFSGDLFHEPAWDMLLALFVAGEDRVPMNVKKLVACAKAPATTSQRWIDHLHSLKLVERVIDMQDRRRIEVSLSDAGERAIRNYLADLRQGPAAEEQSIKPN